jgi:hypothetical protein
LTRQCKNWTINGRKPGENGKNWRGGGEHDSKLEGRMGLRERRLEKSLRLE